MSPRKLTLPASLSVVVLAACGQTTSSTAQPLASDASIDVVDEGLAEASDDAANDVSNDVATDVLAEDVATEASQDVATDAPDDVAMEASTDASTSDASDSGGDASISLADGGYLCGVPNPDAGQSCASCVETDGGGPSECEACAFDDAGVQLLCA